MSEHDLKTKDQILIHLLMFGKQRKKDFYPKFKRGALRLNLLQLISQELVRQEEKAYSLSRAGIQKALKLCNLPPISPVLVQLTHQDDLRKRVETIYRFYSEAIGTLTPNSEPIRWISELVELYDRVKADKEIDSESHLTELLMAIYYIRANYFSTYPVHVSLPEVLQIFHINPGTERAKWIDLYTAVILGRHQFEKLDTAAPKDSQKPYDPHVEEQCTYYFDLESPMAHFIEDTLQERIQKQELLHLTISAEAPDAAIIAGEMWEILTQKYHLIDPAFETAFRTFLRTKCQKILESLRNRK
jgi:hypothetical protein